MIYPNAFGVLNTGDATLTRSLNAEIFFVRWFRIGKACLWIFGG